jgi:hypothetical protein
VVSGYNTGSADDRRAALDATFQFTQALIAIATGTVVFSATFLDRIFTGSFRGLLIAAWLVLGLSVVFGVLAFGAYVSKLAESNFVVRRTDVELFNLLQLIALCAGVGLFALFAVRGITEGPKLNIVPQSALIAKKRYLRIPIECRVSGGGGCLGTATLSAADGREIASKQFRVSSFGGTLVRLLLPERMCSEIRRAKETRVRIHVSAGDRSGQEASADAPLTMVPAARLDAAQRRCGAIKR